MSLHIDDMSSGFSKKNRSSAVSRASLGHWAIIQIWGLVALRGTGRDDISMQFESVRASYTVV